MGNFMTVFAYLGPETMLPMTSVVAGVAGVVMMFGRSTWTWTKAFFKKVVSPSRAKPAEKIRRIGAGPLIRANSGAHQKDQVEA